MKSYLFRSVIVVLISGSFLYSQNLKEQTTRLFSYEDKSLLKDYLTPLSKSLGITLGSGTYYNAESHSFPHFDFGINLLTMSVPGKLKKTKTDSTERATVFGDTKIDTNDVAGLGINLLEIPVFQLNFGIGDDTEIIIRYIVYNDKKLGKIKTYGAGLKYELENLFSISSFPFNIGLLAIYQKVFIDNYMEGAVFGMNLISSKRLGFLPFEVYGGAGYVNNVTNISDPEERSVESISLPGLEEVRFQMGLNFSTRFFTVNADYNFGTYKSLNAGLHLTF